MQIRSIGAPQQAENRAAPSRSSACMISTVFPGGGALSQRTPELHKRVQGGCATMSRSQPSSRMSRTSATMWRFDPSSAGSKSQDQAS
jgi:hypothetical protein